MAGEDDCYYPIKIDPSSLAELKRLLDADHLARVGCRVVKHSDCCVLCAMNTDCTRLPMHWRCRCVAEGYLESA
jgi:hypothetical protein